MLLTSKISINQFAKIAANRMMMKLTPGLNDPGGRKGQLAPVALGR